MNYGFGIYRIEGGRFEPRARFVVADPLDDADGLYIECRTLADAELELEQLTGAAA